MTAGHGAGAQFPQAADGHEEGGRQHDDLGVREAIDLGDVAEHVSHGGDRVAGVEHRLPDGFERRQLGGRRRFRHHGAGGFDPSQWRGCLLYTSRCV